MIVWNSESTKEQLQRSKMWRFGTFIYLIGWIIGLFIYLRDYL